MISNNTNWVPARNAAPSLPQGAPALNPGSGPGISTQYPSAVPFQRHAAPYYASPHSQPVIPANSQQNRGLTEMLQDSLTKLNHPSPPTNGTLPPPRQQPFISQNSVPYQIPQGIPQGSPQGVFLTLPAWMQGKGAIPPLYHQVSSVCADPRQSYYINTDRIQPVLLSSKLDKEKLKQIWSLCNQTVPGVLTLTECYTVLGLMALAQHGHEITMDGLASFSFIPVPTLELATSQPPKGAYPQVAHPPRLPVNNSSTLSPNADSQQTFELATTANSGGNLENTKIDTSFGDFQSATFDKSSSQSTDSNSEFGGFTSAPPQSKKLDAVLNFPNLNPTLPPSAVLSPLDTPPPLPSVDSTLPEDKYSCFRDIGTKNTTAPTKVSPNVFSGGAGAEDTPMNSDDVTDRYSHLRALDETCVQKSEPSFLTDTNSNSQPVMGLSESQPQVFSCFEQALTNNSPSLISTSGNQDGVVISNTNMTEFSDFTQFTYSGNSTISTKTDSTNNTGTNLFDPTDFSVFHSASTNPTYTLSGLEQIVDATESKGKLTTPTNLPTIPAARIDRTQFPLAELSFQTAVATEPRTLPSDSVEPGQNLSLKADTVTAPLPILEVKAETPGILDEYIPFQSAAFTQESTDTPVPSDTNKKYDSLSFDVFHTSIPTPNSDSIFIPTTLQSAATSDSMIIPTTLQSAERSNPVIIPTTLPSAERSNPIPILTTLQSAATSDPIIIPTTLLSAERSNPIPIPTTLQSAITSSDIVLPIEIPLENTGKTHNSHFSDIPVTQQNDFLQKSDEFPSFSSGDFSLLNEPPPLDDAPADEHPEEREVYNFSGFHSSLPDESDRETHDTKPTDIIHPGNTNPNLENTTIFSTLSDVALPHDIGLETEQDVQPSDTTPLAPPSSLLSGYPAPPGTDLGEKTPLAIPGSMPLTDQLEVGNDNMQDLVFNFSHLDSNSASHNAIPLPSNLDALTSNSNTNSFHTASQPLNSDLEQETSRKETPTDPDPFTDLAILSSLQTSDLMKGQSSKLVQPNWTLFDTFSNALQDLNSVPIDNYKNQKFQPKKETSESFPRKERLSYRHDDVEFEAFKSAVVTDPNTGHKPLARAPSYKLSEDSSSELKEAWSQLLSACSAVVHTCLEKVKSASSVHVLKELCSHQKSKLYFEAVFEVMKIVCRIKRHVPDSWEVHSLTLDDVALDWANVKSYLNHGGLQFSDIPTEGPKRDEPPQFCGVCLNTIGEVECRIAFGGFDYHNTCGNFWLNEVGSMLPRLTRESLEAIL